MAEAHHSICGHVAADHTVRKARLERLIDNASTIGEIRLATRHQLGERHFFGHGTATRVKHADGYATCGGRANKLDLPHALAAVAAVLFEYTRPGRLKPRRKLLAQRKRTSVDIGVSAPAECPRAIEDLLHAHLEDDVGVRADPNSLGCYVAQQGIKRGSGPPVGDGIDPDQDSIQVEKLRPHLVDHVVCIHGGLGLDASPG
jgi:hypothetical protein